MQLTRSLAARAGLLRRSAAELARQAQIAISLETVTVPSKPYEIITFDQPDSIEECKTMSDGDMGGFSKSILEYVQGSDGAPSHAKWTGTISRELPKNKPKLLIAGYAGFRTLDRQAHLFGRGFMNLDPYAFLAFRVKSDGRKYLVNVQTDSIEPTDLHQHRLYTKRTNEWETIMIGLHEFVRTNDGRVVEPQSDMLTEKINSIGFSLIDREPGPFELQVQKIWATNALDVD